MESVEFSADFIDNFQGTARITNTEDATRTAGFTFTLFLGEDLVAGLIGSAGGVPPGQTVTVRLLSIDPYVEGEYSIDFEVDFSF